MDILLKSKNESILYFLNIFFKKILEKYLLKIYTFILFKKGFEKYKTMGGGSPLPH